MNCKRLAHILSLLMIVQLAFAMEPPPEKPLNRLKTEQNITESILPKLLKNITLSEKPKIEGTITLVTNDGVEYKVNKSLGFLAGTVKNALKDVGGTEPMPLPNVDSAQLKHIVAILTPFDQMSTATAQISADLIEQMWSPIFKNMPFSDLIKVFEAANYLEISELFDYIVALIASQLQLDKNIDSVVALIESLEKFPADFTSPITKKLMALNNPLSNRLISGSSKVFAVPIQTLIVFNPKKNNLLLSVSVDDELTYFDLETEKIIKQFKAPGNIKSLAISADGDHALTGSMNGDVIYWNLDTGDHYTLKGTTNGSVYAVSFSADGKYALAGSDHGTVCCWDLATRNVTKQLISGSEGYGEAVTSITVSADGKQACVGTRRHSIYMYDLMSDGDTITPKKSFWGQNNDHLTDPCNMPVKFSSDCQYAISKLQSSKQLSTLAEPFTRKLLVYLNDAPSLALSSDGKQALSGGFAYNARVRLWNLTTSEMLLDLKGHTGEIYAVTMSPSGKLLISASYDRTVRLWDLSVLETISFAEIVLMIKLSQATDKVDVLFHPDFSKVFRTLLKKFPFIITI